MRDVGLDVRVARDLRPRGVLQHHQADAQRAPGQPAGTRRGAVEHLAAVQRDQRLAAVGGLGRVHRPRPAAGRDPVAGARQGAQLGLALPHRSVNPESGHARGAAPVPRALPGRRVPHAAVRAAGDRRPCPYPAAGDRPARAEEHGVLARGCGLHLRAVRDRRRPAAAVPGVALRPVEGPARRDRRLPDRQAGGPERAARAGRVDGDRRPGGVGLLQRDGRPRRRRPRHPHPQQPQQRRRDRGQRVPVAQRRRDPEVDPRGLRADRHRGDLEGAAVHRRRGRAGSRCR